MINDILKGIDKTESESPDGWWETSAGAEFGATKLKEVLVEIEKKDKEIAELKAENIAWANKHFEEMAEKDRDSLALRHKVYCLTALLNDDERVERIVHQEGFGSLANESYILGRRKGINDYRAEILKEAL